MNTDKYRNQDDGIQLGFNRMGEKNPPDESIIEGGCPDIYRDLDEAMKELNALQDELGIDDGTFHDDEEHMGETNKMAGSLLDEHDDLDEDIFDELDALDELLGECEDMTDEELEDIHDELDDLLDELGDIVDEIEREEKLGLK